VSLSYYWLRGLLSLNGSKPGYMVLPVQKLNILLKNIDTN